MLYATEVRPNDTTIDGERFTGIVGCLKRCPGHGEFDDPAIVRIEGIVEAAFGAHGDAQPRQIPGLAEFLSRMTEGQAAAVVFLRQQHVPYRTQGIEF